MLHSMPCQSWYTTCDITVQNTSDVRRRQVAATMNTYAVAPPLVLMQTAPPIETLQQKIVDAWIASWIYIYETWVWLCDQLGPVIAKDVLNKIVDAIIDLIKSAMTSGS